MMQVALIPEGTKPRIFKAGALWICSSPTVKGFGASPMQSFERWSFWKEARPPATTFTTTYP